MSFSSLIPADKTDHQLQSEIIFPSKFVNLYALNPMIIPSQFGYELPQMNPISQFGYELPQMNLKGLMQMLSQTCSPISVEDNPNSKQEKTPQLKHPQNTLTQTQSSQQNNQSFHIQGYPSPNCQLDQLENEQKKQDQSPKKNRKSNCIKNFILAFHKKITQPQNLLKLLQEQQYGFLRTDSKKMLKKIKDNISKKVKYAQRCRKEDHIKSMLQHKNLEIRSLLIQECKKYLREYPLVIQKKTKITDLEKNLEVIETVSSVIEKMEKETKKK